MGHHRIVKVTVLFLQYFTDFSQKYDRML